MEDYVLFFQQDEKEVNISNPASGCFDCKILISSVAINLWELFWNAELMSLGLKGKNPFSFSLFLFPFLFYFSYLFFLFFVVAHLLYLSNRLLSWLNGLVLFYFDSYIDSRCIASFWDFFFTEPTISLKYPTKYPSKINTRHKLIELNDCRWQGRGGKEYVLCSRLYTLS